MRSMKLIPIRSLPALTALLVLAVCAASCSSSPTKTQRPTTTTGTREATTSTTTTMAPPTTTVPGGSPVPSGFEPGSVTFVSASTGFVIGIDSACAAGSCVALARTSDAGAHWVSLPAPPAAYVNRVETTATIPAVSEVRFADVYDGWIYGPSLLATHDGGATWQPVDLGGSVVDLETSGGFVDAVVSPCGSEETCSGPLRLEQAPATGGEFTTVLTGPTVQSSSTEMLALSLHAPVGFVDLRGPDSPQGSLWATSNLADPSGWNSFANPCAVAAGYSLDAFVAPDVTSLYSLCSGEGGAGSVMKEVVKTQGGQSVVVGQLAARWRHRVACGHLLGHPGRLGRLGCQRALPVDRWRGFVEHVVIQRRGNRFQRPRVHHLDARRGDPRPTRPSHRLRQPAAHDCRRWGDLARGFDRLSGSSAVSACLGGGNPRRNPEGQAGTSGSLGVSWGSDDSRLQSGTPLRRSLVRLSPLRRSEFSL